MSALVLLLVISEGLIAVGLAWCCWYLSRELEHQAESRHARHPVPDHPRFGPLTATPPSGFEVVRKDGMIRVGTVRDEVIERKQVPDHPPWTGSQRALTEDQVIEMDRQAFARAELVALGDDPTESGVGRVMAALRAMPGSGRRWAPEYNEAPQLVVDPALAKRVIA